MYYDLKDYIMYVENVVPSELCDRIVAEYKECNSWCPAFIAAGEDKSVRNCDNLSLSLGSVIAQNYDVRQKLDQDLFQCAVNAMALYKAKFPECVIEEDTGYILLRYTQGGFYHQHTDSFKKEPRAITSSFALNDDFEGGEFAFFDGELKFKLAKGSMIMFPANFMYPHEICEVTKGTRYSVVTWYR